MYVVAIETSSITKKKKSTMPCLWIMFVTAVCFLFRLKLKWPKKKNIYDQKRNCNLPIKVEVNCVKPNFELTYNYQVFLSCFSLRPLKDL